MKLLSLEGGGFFVDLISSLLPTAMNRINHI
jgi:hypothetical protein